MIPENDQIIQEIKRGINVTFENKCYGSVLILIYAGIDMMAHLGMPDNQTEGTPEDFIGWVDEYLTIDSEHVITAEEIYSARCAVLHTYGVKSKRTRSGKCRMIGYCHGNLPPVSYKPDVKKDFLLLNIEILKNSFFEAIDKFFIEFFVEEGKSEIMNNRLNWLLANIESKRLGK